jgi:3-oxoacyl-[acyl-carrier-protein] synthase-1
MDVIATAMVTSLGYDAATSCAAARAGLTRASELPFTVLENDHTPGLAIGHTVGLLGGGFEGDGRLIRLLDGALRDLANQLPVEQVARARFGIYLAIPASTRERSGSELILPDERARYFEQLGEPKPANELARAKKLFQTAAQLAGIPPSVLSSAITLRVSVIGHAAAIELYELARADLESGVVELAILGAVDSLVGSATLRWLQLTGRLKSAESPAGLSPGEAAALVVLQGSAAVKTAIPPVARLSVVTRTTSPTQLLLGQQADGLGQFQVLRALTKAVGGNGALWVNTDQNGEVFRGTDWGCSLVRLEAVSEAAMTNASVWYAAASFGDVGAASGVLATCLAVRAHERRYAPSIHGLVLCNSDGADRAGCVVSAAEVKYGSRQ